MCMYVFIYDVYTYHIHTALETLDLSGNAMYICVCVRACTIYIHMTYTRPSRRWTSGVMPYVCMCICPYGICMYVYVCVFAHMALPHMAYVCMCGITPDVYLHICHMYVCVFARAYTTYIHMPCIRRSRLWNSVVMPYVCMCMCACIYDVYIHTALETLDISGDDVCMFACVYCLLHLECHLITISNLNLPGFFSTERGKRDLANRIND